MKIATWNVERLKHKNQIDQILSDCTTTSADILVLTETDQCLRPDYQYCFETPLLTTKHGALYKPTENRVSIFTNYPYVRKYATYDKHTALCVELKTEIGNMLVYGTIIGIYGNRHSNYIQELKSQMNDIKRLSKLCDGFCFCGDFNCSFADNYYFTKEARDILLETFAENNIQLLTGEQPECIDHIAVSKSLADSESVEIEEWNINKDLSDHKGIAVAFANNKI